jgi:hypothetical protein
MFRVLVVVLCSDKVASLSFGSREFHIPFIISSGACGVTCTGAGTIRRPKLRAAGKSCGPIGLCFYGWWSRLHGSLFDGAGNWLERLLKRQDEMPPKIAGSEYRLFNADRTPARPFLR